MHGFGRFKIKESNPRRLAALACGLVKLKTRLNRISTMTIPLTWLRDYVDITLAPAQLIERLTLAGLEVASTRVLGLPIPDGVRIKAEERGPVWDRDKIFVAQILGVDKHPNADKLKLPTVTWGE